MELVFRELSAVFGEEKAKAFILKQPSLLTMSWEKNLMAKVDFIMKELGYTKEELFMCPVALLVSLEKRLKPRQALLKKADKLQDARLSHFAKLTDVAFTKRFRLQDIPSANNDSS
eukprot:TRINITY_DN2290_c0_g1_i1.p1 TRINITY_DN2290_c0_g1~~TRINITY_DN2290_c0_g1_i1.p1  ORF type:complete len:125 (+),score=18.97 TRINITY_DN2290_c0_g1_i1:30-377(+)